MHRALRRTITGLAAAVALAAGTVAVPAAARADAESAGGSYRVVWDDFRSGFTHGTGGKWALSAAGSLPDGDGIATTSASGLTVVPTGRNATTGKPAFAYTTGQEHDGGAGQADHLKWYAVANHTASTGVTGFDAVPGKVLTCGARLGARAYGTEQNPFGAEVADPQSDLRLASAGLSAIDYETMMVFDFFVTNTKLYAFYERLPTPGAAYAPFSYALPVADRTPGTQHDLAISYDRAAGTVVWKADGREVFSMNRLGFKPADRSHLLLDLGGTDQAAAPRQLSCGLGMFAILDGEGDNGHGLVRLTDQPDRYYDPHRGAPTPETFADDLSLPGNRLWGQGAQLDVDRVTISSLPR